MSSNDLTKLLLSTGVGYIGTSLIFPHPKGFQLLTPSERMTTIPWDILGEGSAEALRKKGGIGGKPCMGPNCPDKKRAYQGNITNPNPMGMPEGIPDIKSTGVIAAVLGIGFIVALFVLGSKK